MIRYDSVTKEWLQGDPFVSEIQLRRCKSCGLYYKLGFVHKCDNEDIAGIDKLGSRIRKLRKNKGIPMWKLAEDLSEVTPTICNWENGKQIPHVVQIIALSDYFNVSVEWLIRGD